MEREEGGQGRRVALSPFRGFFEFGLLLFLYQSQIKFVFRLEAQGPWGEESKNTWSFKRRKRVEG